MWNIKKSQLSYWAFLTFLNSERNISAQDIICNLPKIPFQDRWSSTDVLEFYQKSTHQKIWADRTRMCYKSFRRRDYVTSFFVRRQGPEVWRRSGKRDNMLGARTERRKTQWPSGYGQRTRIVRSTGRIRHSATSDQKENEAIDIMQSYNLRSDSPSNSIKKNRP